ncbi:MAG TPA: hypothetical protein VFH21_05910 [Burkholderiales bacterium]|nr:hypothetical protein [Burkholderiales bacterium]
MIILPGTGPIPVDPEPFKVWMSLSSSKRDLLVGLALSEIASLISDKKSKQQVKKAGLDLAEKAARNLFAPGGAKSQAREQDR